MLCPKCKKELSEGILKCSHCNARVAVICKNCSAYNSVFNLNCISCNNELLKFCPQCQAVNLPEAEKCRKCGIGFTKIDEVTDTETLATENIEEIAIQEPEPESESGSELEKKEEIIEQEEPSPINYEVESHTQQRANELLIQGVLSNNTKFISLNGKNGTGKTIVLKSAMHNLKKNGFTWLYGACSCVTQLSPLGFIQDLLQTFFNIPAFCVDGVKIQKDSQKFFHSEFPSLNNKEIFNLLNFLYPTNPDYYENILQNKAKTFTFLEKVFRTIIENHDVILVAENFELIDGLSYEFLTSLVNSDLIKKSFKLVLTYNAPRPARAYFDNHRLKDEAYLDISLGNFDTNQMNLFIEQSLIQAECPTSTKEFIFATTEGNPAFLEQYIALLNDSYRVTNSFDLDLPSSINAVIKKRLDFLRANQEAYNILSLAAIQGSKFSPQIINEILNLDENQFYETMVSLESLNFIMPVNENGYTFKTSTIWEEVFECIKQDEAFLSYNNALFNVYSKYILSSHSLRAVIAENLNENQAALNIWTENIKLAAYIGDTNLYIISQKQCLILIEKIENLSNKYLIKNNIYERLGKLLSNINPQEAMEFLPNAIQRASEEGNLIKEIELTGYLASCCIALGNYYGTVECVDAISQKLPADTELELAMLKSRKVEALLNIGNCGEIINLVDNEILPIFDKYINAKPHKNISINVLYKAWLQTYLNLANALVMQGNNRSFSVIATLFELFEKNNFKEELFICKTKLALAFANTIKGEIETSEKVLSEIIKVYGTDIMDNEAIARWNMINILNNFVTRNRNGLKEELFQVVTFANNINDNFTKNILKTLLGKVFKDEENAKHALEIYSDQITYFSKERNAIGALLSWYLISDAKLVAEGPDKALEVANKALELAQSPKINNYIFVVLFNKVIAESYIVANDYEMAKIHMEKAIAVAKNFELLTQLAELYLLYGKYLQDIAIVKKEAQVDYVTGAAKMYKKAGLISQGIKNNYILSNVEKSKNVLSSFCKLHGIELVE